MGCCGSAPIPARKRTPLPKAGLPVKQTFSMGNEYARLTRKVRERFSSGDFDEFEYKRTSSRTSSRKSTRCSHYGDNQVPENQNPAFYEKDGKRAPPNHVNPGMVPDLPTRRSQSSEAIQDFVSESSYVSTNLPKRRGSQQDFLDQLEEFKRKREQLRKEREALFGAHEENMKKFNGEANRLKSQRKHINDLCEQVNSRCQRQKSRIDSQKLLRQRTLEKEEEDKRNSLERFKEEMGPVRGFSMNSGRFRNYGEQNTRRPKRTRPLRKKKSSVSTSRRPPTMPKGRRVPRPRF